MSLPFAGLVTFAMVPRYDPAEAPAPHAAVLGIPTDEGATQHPGARYGPRAIRDASTRAGSPPGGVGIGRSSRHHA